MCGCGCISCAWPASWPRSARRICAFPSARPASCLMPRVSACPGPGWRCCTSGPKGGRRAFPPGADHPELALVRAMGDLVQGRLDEAAAHLAVAETHVRTTPPDRRRRLGVAVASLQLALARRRGHLAGVIEHVRFLDSPVTGQSDEDITLGGDLRAVALMNLGTAEAWSLERPDAPDAERHLREGADLARQIGRPYLEVGCLAQLGFASLVLHSFATTQRRCREAIALAERHGWGAEPVIAPALIMLAGTMIWTGEFDEGERWLQCTARAL